MEKLLELKAKLARQKELLADAKEEDEKAFVKKKILKLESEIEVLANEQSEAEKKILKHDKIRNTCPDLIKKIKEVVSEYEGVNRSKSASKPAKKKRVSSFIAENIASTIRRAVNKETTRDKVSKIDTDSLKEAEKHFVDGLKSLRNALGGISSDNDSFIKSFKSEIDELVKNVKEKQEALKQKA